MTRLELRRRWVRKKWLLFGSVCVLSVLLIVLSINLAAPGNEQRETQLPEATAESEDRVDLVIQTQYRLEDLSSVTVLVNTEDAEGDETTEPTEEEEPIPEETEPAEDETPPYLSDEVPLDYDTQTHVMYWCEEYGVPYSLVLAVIETESSFRPDAKSGTCYGYMQINSINLGWLSEDIGITDLMDPLQNIQAGVYMLSTLYGKYGDWNKALAAYNLGEVGAYNYVFSKGYTSTEFSRLVMARAESWAEVIGAG